MAIFYILGSPGQDMSCTRAGARTCSRPRCPGAWPSRRPPCVVAPEGSNELAISIYEPWSKLLMRGFYRDHMGSFIKGLLGCKLGVLTIAHMSVCQYSLYYPVPWIHWGVLLLLQVLAPLSTNKYYFSGFHPQHSNASSLGRRANCFGVGPVAPLSYGIPSLGA